MSFALRELRRHMVQPKTLAGLGAAVLVLVLAGPFSTAEALGVPMQGVYWALVVFGSYGLGTMVFSSLAASRLKRSPTWRYVFMGAGLNALLVTGLIVGVNVVILDVLPALAGLPVYLGTIFAIALAVSLAIAFISMPEDTVDTEAVPRLIARLPLNKRGMLLSLSAEDHYVRVRTDKGEELVLMRLADAIAEAAPTQGLQVHRSHWVAVRAVEAARREGQRAIITVGGLDLPVSRANVAQLKEAGVLPR